MLVVLGLGHWKFAVCADESSYQRPQALCKPRAARKTWHFQALTEHSVGQWFLEQRLHYCQQLLEKTKLSIEQVAERAGFNSVVTLRHHFRQQFKVSPSDWRKTFAS